MDESIEIRFVQAGDGERLLEIFMSSIHALAASDYSAAEIAAWTSRMDGRRLETRLMGTTGLVASASGQVVGFGALDAVHGELDFLYVHPSFSRRGIGRRLAAAIEERAALAGLKRLELTASLNAVAVYERFGYRRLRDMVKTIDHVAVPCVRMEKDLV